MGLWPTAEDSSSCATGAWLCKAARRNILTPAHRLRAARVNRGIRMPAELTTPQTSCTRHRATPGPRNTRKLIWFLVPSFDVANGGVMSICRFHAETKTLPGGVGVTVVASTYPNAPVLTKYTRFKNSMEIFSFAEIITHFHSVEHAVLHIPEYFCKDFVNSLSPSERLFLDTIPRLHINMMLQNIDQCEPGDIAPLRTLTDEITCTTAHERYSTQEQSKRFGIPLHKLSVFVNRFEQHGWTEKQDIIVLSPDRHPLRDQVIDFIAKGLPHVEIVTVAAMPYESYRLLIAKSKWSLTFGEGLDYFFCEMALTGGIPFAVYNDRFFMPEFRDLSTVYDTWHELQVSMVKDILYLDHDDVYQAAGEPIRRAVKHLYNNESYRENIRLFYEERYSFPGASPGRVRRDDEMLARIRRVVLPIKQKEQALEEAIAARDANIAQLKQAIAARDADIAHFREGIDTRDFSIDRLSTGIAALNTTVAQMREGIIARDASIDAFQAEILAFKQSTSWKLTNPLRSTVQLVRSGVTAVKNVSRRMAAGGK